MTSWVGWISFTSSVWTISVFGSYTGISISWISFCVLFISTHFSAPSRNISWISSIGSSPSSWLPVWVTVSDSEYSILFISNSHSIYSPSTFSSSDMLFISTSHSMSSHFSLKFCISGEWENAFSARICASIWMVSISGCSALLIFTHVY